MTQACRLYLITPPRLDPAAFRETLAAALDAGDVACLQLRLKDASPDDVKRATEALMPLCHARDVAFILNDDAMLAHPGRGCCWRGRSSASPAMPRATWP